MSKKRFSPEEVEDARRKWQQKHPELAVKRKSNKLAPDEKQAEESPVDVQEHIAENFPLFPQFSQQDVAMANFRKEVEDFAMYLHQKCETFVQTRNLENAALTMEEQMFFHKVVLFWYRPPIIDSYAISAVAKSLLVDGLRYPDKKLNDFCVNFLERVEREHGISWTLWMNLWSRPFVPADAIRLMMFQEDGEYSRKESFKEIVPMLKNKIFRHLEAEHKRLETAKEIADPLVREREVERKQRRIRLFEQLVDVYNL